MRERLGDPQTLPSIEQAKAQIAANISDKLKHHLQQAEKDKQRHSATFEFMRKDLVESQRNEREQLERKHKERWEQETNTRAKRLSSGLKGIWHRLTGKYAKAKQQNEMEILLAIQRDRKEKDELIFKHIEQLRQDIQEYRAMNSDKPSKLQEEFRKESVKP